MRLNAKDKVLVVLYLEYQNNLPNMKRINARGIGITVEEFFMAIKNLEREGYIEGSIVVNGGDSPVPVHVVITDTIVTPLGERYIEQKFNVNEELTNEEKRESIFEKLKAECKDLATTIIAKIFVELATKPIPPAY